MMLTRSLLCAALSTLLGCSTPNDGASPAPQVPQSGADAEPPTELITEEPAEPVDPNELGGLEIIKPGEVVPAFSLTAEDGTVLDSKELVGTKPFVMVFFASWCKVCEETLPHVTKALQNAGPDLLTIGVALDNDETWDLVAPFVERHGIGHFKLVRGQQNRRFAVGYNPFGSVPVVEVIDRSGVITELLRGYREGHEARLFSAIELVQNTSL